MFVNYFYFDNYISHCMLNLFFLYFVDYMYMFYLYIGNNVYFK
jgi:hypothetical protein